MKNLYLEKMKALSIAGVLLLSASTVFAQTVINWRGTNTNDADDLNNWKELTNMAGNDVVVGHEGTLANWPNVKYPVTTAAGDLTINSLACANPQAALTEADPITGAPAGTVYGGSSFTIDKPDGSVFYTQKNAINYWGGTLIVKSGTFKTRSSFYLEHNDSKLVVEGIGNVIIQNAFMMGKNPTQATGTGGTVVVKDNGQLNLPGIDRFNDVNTSLSIMTISDNAIVSITGNRVDYLKNRLFTTGQVRGGEGYVPYVYYNNITNKTIIVAKSAAVPFLYATDHLMLGTERLIANQEGKEISVLPNAALLTNAQAFTWKYGTNVDGPYDMVLEGFSTQTIKPKFPSLGTFYLVCEITKENGDKVVSTPLQYIISTDKVTLTPEGKQYLRLGQQTGVVGVVENGVVTSREWKYTTTPGENYASFDPVQTGATFQATFPAIGSYYIVCESVVDGTSLRSKELEVLVQKRNDGSLNITWTGMQDDKWANIYNWSPYAYADKNNVIIPVTNIVNWPVFSTSVDTIYGGSGIYAGAKLYVRGNTIEDTLKQRSDIYGFDGDLIVESGVFVKDVSFLRLDVSTARLVVKGSGKAIINASVLMGNNNTPTDGGFVEVDENGVVVFNELPGRFSADATKTFGKIIVKGNGTAQFKGNQYTQIASWVSLARIETVEGFQLKYYYDPVTDYTYVQARDVAGFSIAQTQTQYIGPDQLTSEIGLSNAGALTGFEWQYSSSPFGPWNSFSTPVEGETAHVSFPAGGTYFVICKASDGTYTNNVLRVNVVDLPITVSINASSQQELSVALPAGATAVEWKMRAESETEYQPIGFGITATTYVPDATEYMGDGIYYVVFVATVKDDNDQPVTILSKPVKIVIANGVVENISTAAPSVKVEQLSIYPNPTAGTFFVNAVKGGSVSVTDVKGAVVLNQVLSAGKQSVTLSAKGVYVVKVVDGTQVKIGRVVVK